jgi:hypothetical protein
LIPYDEWKDIESVVKKNQEANGENTNSEI